ncbi:hypothetical protein [Trichothermofontia sp.]
MSPAEESADQAEQQVRQIVQNLRQAGMDVTQITQVMGLSLDQVNALH